MNYESSFNLSKRMQQQMKWCRKSFLVVHKRTVDQNEYIIMNTLGKAISRGSYVRL